MNMAGLEAFVRRDNLASRQSAQAIKFPTGKKAIESPKPIIPAVLRHGTPPAPKDIFESSTISSDFDITRSEVTVGDDQYATEPYEEVNEQEAWNYGPVRYEAPHTIQSIAQTPMHSKRTGRFESGLPPRSSKIDLPQNGHSKKRSHSRQNSPFAPARNYSEERRMVDDDEYQESTADGSQAEQEVQVDDTIHAGQSIGNFDASSLGDSTIETPSRDNARGRGDFLRSPSAQFSTPFNPDYNDKELRGMTYSNLKEEAFETDPHPPQPDVPAYLQGPNISLSDRISYFVDSKDVEAQSVFFGRMTMDEWEQTGEWFMEKFGSILQEFSKARKNKRMLVTRFEEEIGSRENAVRGKISGIDREFDDMQNGGELVLRGKSV